MEKPATDPYNLRTRAQTRSRKPDRRLDITDEEEGVATTVGEIARQTDYQTDIHTRHLSDHNIASMAPALIDRTCQALVLMLRKPAQRLAPS